MFNGEKFWGEVGDVVRRLKSPQSPVIRRYWGSYESVRERESLRRQKKPIPHDAIKQRAEELWDRDGRQEGRDEYHWITAERQLENEGHLLFGVFVRGERGMEAALRWFKGLALFDILQILSNAGIAIAVFTFVVNQDIRHDQEVFTAWQTITSAAGEPGNGGRKEAIEFLNSRPFRFPWFCREGRDYPDCIYRQMRGRLGNLDVSIKGEYDKKAPGRWAYLARLQARDANLREADLQGANLRQANLQGASLWKANLQDSVLREANLQGANFWKARLQNADLLGANLKDAKLSETEFERATYSTRDSPCPKSIEAPCPTIFPEGFKPLEAGMVIWQPEE